MTCILGLDIGTTSTVGILIRLPDQVVGIASRPMILSSPQPGWTEQDPERWWINVCAVTREILGWPGVDPSEVKAVGVTGMLPATVLLDDSDRLLRPSIQQSDARCGAEVEELRKEYNEEAFVGRTGNGITQQLIIAKLRWIEKYEPDVFTRLGTVFGSYDYINWRLTGQKAVERNWALEGGFVDLRTHRIANDLVALAHIPSTVIPRLSVPHHVLGEITTGAASATGLCQGTPVVGGSADLIASALTMGIVDPGQVLLKFGGSVDILVATDRIAPDRRLYLDYHLIPGLYMPNGCMATGGSALNWFAENFAGGQLSSAIQAEITLHERLDQLGTTVPPGSDGLTILPYFLGEKTPIHDTAARGIISGLSFTHGIGHLWRAMLEAYGFGIMHHLEVLREIGHAPKRYLVSDGGSRSRLWMQIVADVLQEPLQCIAGHPGSCLGAAWVAAIGTGQVDDWLGASRFVSDRQQIDPNPLNGSVYAERYRVYRELYTSRGTPHVHANDSEDLRKGSE